MSPYGDWFCTPNNCQSSIPGVVALANCDAFEKNPNDSIERWARSMLRQ
jgi:hypothetical protein